MLFFYTVFSSRVSCDKLSFCYRFVPLSPNPSSYQPNQASAIAATQNCTCVTLLQPQGNGRETEKRVEVLTKYDSQYQCLGSCLPQTHQYLYSQMSQSQSEPLASKKYPLMHPVPWTQVHQSFVRGPHARGSTIPLSVDPWLMIILFQIGIESYYKGQCRNGSLILYRGRKLYGYQ